MLVLIFIGVFLFFLRDMIVISLEAHSMGGVSEPRSLCLALCAFSSVLCISLNDLFGLYRFIA